MSSTFSNEPHNTPKTRGAKIREDYQRFKESDCSASLITAMVQAARRYHKTGCPPPDPSTYRRSEYSTRKLCSSTPQQLIVVEATANNKSGGKERKTTMRVTLAAPKQNDDPGSESQLSYVIVDRGGIGTSARVELPRDDYNALLTSVMNLAKSESDLFASDSDPRRRQTFENIIAHVQEPATLNSHSSAHGGGPHQSFVSSANKNYSASADRGTSITPWNSTPSGWFDPPEENTVQKRYEGTVMKDQGTSRSIVVDFERPGGTIERIIVGKIVTEPEAGVSKRVEWSPTELPWEAMYHRFDPSGHLEDCKTETLSGDGLDRLQSSMAAAQFTRGAPSTYSRSLGPDGKIDLGSAPSVNLGEVEWDDEEMSDETSDEHLCNDLREMSGYDFVLGLPKAGQTD